MICRLCLTSISVENKVSLFNSSDNNDESQAIKLIAKYINLEITVDDGISTTICVECCNHLDEFHKFCVFVEQKQNSLRNEFYEVKCDDDLKSVQQVEPITVDTITSYSDDEATLNIDGEATLDINDVPKVYDVLAVEPIDIPIESHSQGLLPPREVTPTPKTIPSPKKLRASKKQSSLLSPKESSISEPNVNNTKTINDDCTNDGAASINQRIPSADMDAFIAQHLQLKCEECNIPFSKFSDMRPHFQEVHQCRPFAICCSKRFITRKYLYDHLQWHFNPDYFKCDVCKKVLKSGNNLSIHKITHHQKEEELIFNCELCHKKFPRLHILKQHLLYHKTERNFICDLCNKGFTIKKRLENHIHSIHDNIFSHICDFCGKQFKFKPSFEAHIQQHQGIVQPPVQCDDCGEWFKNKNLLRLHMSKHNNVDVECKYCGRVCPSQAALRGHMEYMHRRQQNLQCKYCDRLFKKPINLKEHIATHTGETLYTCPHCPREFRSKANMYAHVKRQHMEEWAEAKLIRPRRNPVIIHSVSSEA